MLVSAHVSVPPSCARARAPVPDNLTSDCAFESQTQRRDVLAEAVVGDGDNLHVVSWALVCVCVCLVETNAKMRLGFSQPESTLAIARTYRWVTAITYIVVAGAATALFNDV